MYGVLGMFVIVFAGVISHPTSCTEDSQCSSGFYCEEGAHFCRECLRCVDLKRESLLPIDACVKSVIDCGACLKGQVAPGSKGTNIDSGGACAPPAAPPAAVLPPLAWAAIAACVLLITIILCVFARTRSFKIIDFASRTSVQSLRQAETAAAPPPPPYNDLDFVPADWRQADAPEAQRLMEMPPLFKKSFPNEEMRPREVSASQAARVFNNPSYIRVPQNNSRCNTPEAPMLIQQIAEDVFTEERSVVEPSRNNIKLDNDTKENEPEAAAVGCNKKTSSVTKTRADTESQDTNNNFYVPEDSQKNQPPHHIVHAGATFVINVVENINNIQQRNDVTF